MIKLLAGSAISKNRTKDKNIPSVSYYSVPLHLQTVFKNLGHNRGDFQVTEKVALQCLSLPMSPYLSDDDQSLIIDTILDLDGN